MSNQLIAELGLQDKGFSEGVNSAKEAVENLSKENGAANTSFKELNKQFKDARTRVRDLSTEYNSLTDTARKGEFGQKLKQQLEDAKKDALQFRDVLDKVQDDLDQIKGKSKNLGKGMDIGGGFDINKMISGTLNASGFGKLGGIVEGLGGAMGGGAAMGAAAMTAGVAAAGIAVKELVDISQEAIQKSAEFGRSMSELGAITGVTGKALQQMRGQVMAVGKDTNTAFSEVARNFALIGGALPELLDNAEGLEEVSRNAITLHKAGLLPLEEATNSLTLAMAQFGLGAKDANMVVNSMAAGSKAGSAEIRDISQAMLNSGAAAKLAGVDFKDTTALIETMAKEGYKGADAGTKLRNVFLTMSTKGIDEINPKVVGLEQALENLKAKASDAAFMTETFGQANIGVASAIANNIDYFNEVRGALDELGVAEEMAVTNSNNLATQWDDMTTKWNNFLSSFDVDNSPLTSIVQEIGAIIDAIDEAVHAIMETSVAQGAIAENAALWEVLGEAIRVVIQILGDVISTVMELTDITGDMSNKSDILTTALKVLKEVLWAIGATVKLLCNGIKWLIDEFHNLMKAAGEQVKDIPFLSTLYNMLIKVRDAIKWCIDSWKEFKKWVDSTDTVKAAADAVEKTKNGTQNGGSDTGTEGTQEKGIIKKLEDEVKRLKEARDNATTEAEIKRYNNLIKQKQNELNKLTGTGNSGGSGSGKKVTANDLANKAEKEYSDALAIIAAEKEFANKKELEAEHDNLKALEKLRDSYIKIPKKTNEHLRRLSEINNAIRRSANSIRVLQETERWADVQNNMFKDLSQSTRQLADGYIDESEWEKRRIKQLKDSIETLYSLSSLNAEQEKALKHYIKELNEFKIDDIKKEWNEEYKDAIHKLNTELLDLSDVINDQPRMNERLKNVNDRMVKKRDLSDEIVKTQVNVSNPQQSGDYLNSAETIKKFHELNFAIESFIEQWKKDANEYDVVTGMVNVAMLKLADMFDEAGKSDLAKELRQQAKDMSNSGEDLQKWIYTNEDMVKAMEELNVDFGDMIDKIKGSGDEMAAALVAVAKELYNQSTPKQTKRGDHSNYDLNQKSYEKLRREVDLTINTVGMDKFDKLYDSLDKQMSKYRDLEQKLIELKNAADNVPGGVNIEATLEYRTAISQMNQLESSIASTANKIQKHLKFEVRMEGLQNAINAFQGLASIGGTIQQFQNLGDTLNQCKTGFDEFLVYLNLFISTMQTVQTVIELVNFFTGLFAAGQAAAATATAAKTTADGAEVGAISASIPVKTAETAANKALEASVLDLAAAQIFAAHAYIPFAGVAIANGFIATMMASMAAQHSASLGLMALAEGGIVGGPKATFTGDTTLIRANKGEMVLNNRQQANLFDLLDRGFGREGFAGNVDFKIQGDTLVGCLKNTNKIKSRTGHSIKL